MIELTPLDVRQKKNDFARALRGYDPRAVEDFLGLVAERLDELVKERLSLAEKVERLERQVTEFRERENALTEALVSAQELREEARVQSGREAELLRREAEQDAQRIRDSALAACEREEETLRRLRIRQEEMVRSYRAMLERELAELAVVTRTLEERSESAGLRAGGAAAAHVAGELALPKVGRRDFEVDVSLDAGGWDTGEDEAPEGGGIGHDSDAMEALLGGDVGSDSWEGPPMPWEQEEGDDQAPTRSEMSDADASSGAGGDPFAAEEADPFAGEEADPFAGEEADPFGTDETDPFAAEAIDPFEVGEATDPWAVPPDLDRESSDDADEEPLGRATGEPGPEPDSHVQPAAATSAGTGERPGEEDEDDDDDAEPDWLASILREEP